MWTIVPDIHGQADKLDALLEHLGWQRRGHDWFGPSGGQRLLFLGDFIDRGPNNRDVIKTVRSLVESGKATAIMGNHEFNAIHYHTKVNNAWLRAHTEKNQQQHASFLAEFPLGSHEAQEAIAWMMDLPLVFEDESLRAVHACWLKSEIDVARTALNAFRIDEALLNRPNWTNSRLWTSVQTITSGVERKLPTGYSFTDKNGHTRHDVRLAWWLDNVMTWRQMARSVPNPNDLPAHDLPADVADLCYKDTKPVFFGHYWMTGTPCVEADYALCLDYSAGLEGGTLVAYHFDPEHPKMDASRFTCV